MTRYRSCDNPSPAHGGRDCVGSSLSSATCRKTACPGVCDVIVMTTFVIRGIWNYSLILKYSSSILAIIVIYSDIKYYPLVIYDVLSIRYWRRSGSASETTPRPTYCDTSDGYIWLHDGNTQLCVTAHSTHRSWSSSRAYCQSEGADLVVLDTHAKYNLLVNNFMLAYGGNTRIWYM